MWKFVVMLLLLLFLAAMAALSTISYIQDVLTHSVPTSSLETLRLPFRTITIGVLSLTMGCLFLSGALGLWAIQSYTTIESHRRIGRLVDAMDYLRDGLLAVDRQHRVTGANPAARRLGVRPPDRGDTVRDLFPSLTDEDMDNLMDPAEPQEVERLCREDKGLRMLRFRSQPADDMNLILISDVTEQKAHEAQRRQIAQLQLIGRVARGVAHDFNNILCAISAHAALLARAETGAAPDRGSLEAILRESQRGANLAGHLLELSRTGVRGAPCDRLPEHIEKAAELLKVGLAPRWQVKVDIRGTYAAVALTPMQVEQVVLNLGLLAADEHPRSGLIYILAAHPAAEPPLDAGEAYEAVIVVSAHDDESTLGEKPVAAAEATAAATAEAGVIPSVVRSMVEELGGRMDSLVHPGGRHSWRIGIPSLQTAQKQGAALASVPEELRAYIANWQVLLARPDATDRNGLEAYLRQAGLRVIKTENVVSTLQQSESNRALNAMILDMTMLGDQAQPLLRAVVKLQPGAALVVLCESLQEQPEHLAAHAVFAPTSAAPDTILQAVLKARELAGRRRPA